MVLTLSKTPPAVNIPQATPSTAPPAPEPTTPDLIAHLTKDRGFTSADFALFAKLKWPLALVERAAIKRVTDADAQEVYGIYGKGVQSGLLYPYYDCLDNTKLLMTRLRRDDDPETGAQPDPKYLQRSGVHHLYVLPGSAELINDRKVPVVIVEAEKSVLSGTAYCQRTGQKFLFVAIGGCQGWHNLPELPLVCWGRPAIVMLDSNVPSNPKVGKARDELVKELHRCHTSDVFVANIPALEGVNGPDDLLALPDGDEKLQAILDHGHMIYCKPAKASAADNWPDPESLGGKLPPVPAFDSQLLPDCLRPLAEDTAYRMDVPLDFPAVMSVVSLAAVVNRRACIQPKSKDTSWIEVGNLWGSIVAPPGTMKSPTMDAITLPLLRIDAEWHEEDEYALAQYSDKETLVKLEMAAWESKVKTAHKNNEPPPAKPKTSLIKPPRRLLVTQDANYESLCEKMVANPAGITIIRDELSGWIEMLGREGRQGERGLYLQSWQGKTPYKSNRIGRGEINVPACCITLLGSIQPSLLNVLMADAMKGGGVNDDGLIQRFQLFIYPDGMPGVKYVDEPINQKALQEAENVYRKLVKLDASQPLRLLFSPDAQQLFESWFVELGHTLHNSDIHPALSSHFSKYRGLMPKLALLFELASGGTQTVSLKHAQKAAAFCGYLGWHARRIYSLIIPPKMKAANELSKRLEQGWKYEEGRFTVRDVYRNEWRGLSQPEEVWAALSILEDAGWVRRVEGNRGKGRPTDDFVINPKVKMKKHGG